MQTVNIPQALVNTLSSFSNNNPSNSLTQIKNILKENLATIVGTSLAVVSIFSAYKIVPKKVIAERIDSLRKKNIHILEMQIKWGLETSRKEEGNKNLISCSKAFSHDDLKNIEDAFANSLDALLKARKQTNQLSKVKDLVLWCKEVKQDPNKLKSKVTDYIFAKTM